MYKTLYNSDTVLVRKHTGAWETYMVTVMQDSGRKRTRKFTGESAWSDTERLAYDHDRAALGCTQEV